MLSAIVTKFLTWLGGRGLRILVQQVGDLLEEMDYREALKENAAYEAAARQRAGDDLTRKAIRDVEGESDIDVIRDLLRDRDAKR